MKVLFVCTGNICRSPTAEGVFRHMLEEEKLTDLIQTDGCGLEGWHTGKQPDQRSMNHAKQRGYDLSSLRARQITQDDFVDFDLILAMDEGHLRDMKQMADAEYHHKIQLFLDPVREKFRRSEVPDPYYGGAEGFELVLDMVEAASRVWLQDIRQKI